MSAFRLILLAALALGTPAGCARQTADARDARRAADRYLAALTTNDLPALRRFSTCMFAPGSVRGANVLRVEPIRTITRSALDSLALVADGGHRAADTSWASATEETADSLFERSRALARRSTLYHNAIRAASLSAGGEELSGSASIRACRVRVRVRWGGPLVGPTPVDREHILRVLAAPGGPWIVYSIYLREEDPSPEPI